MEHIADNGDKQQLSEGTRGGPTKTARRLPTACGHAAGVNLSLRLSKNIFYDPG